MRADTGTKTPSSLTRTIHVGLAGLTVFMLLWITVFPTVARLQTDELEAEKQALRRACAAEQPLLPPWNRGQRINACADRAQRLLVSKTVVIPDSITLKHYQYPGVVLTHHLGALLWLTAGLAQFGLTQEGPAARRRHRLVGRTYMLSVGLLTAGFAQITFHDLYAHFDFHQAFPEVPASSRAKTLGHALAFSGVQLWFLYTAARAWSAARQARYKEHRKWIIRHAASGYWVVVMRVILVVAVSVAIVSVEVFGCTPLSGASKSLLFDLGTFLGMAISFFAAEVYLAHTA
jgi:hypothetical protein